MVCNRKSIKLNIDFDVNLDDIDILIDELTTLIKSKKELIRHYNLDVYNNPDGNYNTNKRY